MALTQIKSAQIDSVAASKLTGQVSVANGGTGLQTSDISENDIIYASAAGTLAAAAPGSTSGVQPFNAELTNLAGLTQADGNFIVSDGTNFTVENGADARTSLGLGSIATQAANNVSITGGSITGIADLAVADGGTGSSDGSITGSGALTFTAGGTNQSITLAPSGTGDVDVSSRNIKNVLSPTDGTDAANKDYVDSVAQGLYWKETVLVATNSNTALTSITSVDGETLANEDRVLLWGQSDSSENGIYVFDGDNNSLSRAADMNAASEFPGSAVFVLTGTYDNQGFVCTNDSNPTVDTDAITFVQFTGVGQITAGAGLSKSGSTLSADLETNAGLELVGSGDSAKLGVKVNDTGVVQINASGQVVALPYINAGIDGSDGDSTTSLTGTSTTVGTISFDNTDFTGANNGNGTSVSTTGGFVQVFLNGVLLTGLISSANGPTAGQVDLLGAGVDYIIIPPDYDGTFGSEEDATATVIHFLAADIDSSDSITIIGFE